MLLSGRFTCLLIACLATSAPTRAHQATPEATTQPAPPVGPPPAEPLQPGEQEPQPSTGRTLRGARAEQPPVIDGQLDDPVWKSAPQATQFVDQFTGRSEIDQTRAWLAYDDRNIYVAFHAQDREPAGIVGREIQRDSSFRGEDSLTFQIDPFRTRRGDDTNYFNVNPLGTGSAYIAGGRADKAEWKGDWESAARRVDDGWTAEMRIPWEMLTLPGGGAPAVLGLNFQRRQQRTQITSYWSNIGPQFRNELAGDWVDVLVPKQAFRRQLSLLPFVTSQQAVHGVRQRPLGIGRDKSFNIGLDARLTLTPGLTGVAALNPDFSTVARAVAGIDFNRGERFVPDVRPFFLEGGEIFDVNVRGEGGWGSAFFSRRVPAFDLGGKVYGRHGAKETLGVLGTYDNKTQRGDLVARWTHDLAPNSYAGAYLVQRSDPGKENTVFGLNEAIRLGDWELRSDIATSAGVKAGGAAGFGSVRWRSDTLRASLGYTYVSPTFNAANGFVRFVDYYGPSASIDYRTQWRTGFIRELDMEVEALAHSRTDGSFFRRQIQTGMSLETRNDWGLRLGWEGGRFLNGRDSEYNIGVIRNLSNRYNRAGISWSFGTRDNDPINFVAPFISRRILGGWDVSVSSSLLFFRGQSQQHIVGINRQFSPTRQLGARILSRDGTLHYFISYRIAGGKGMETYIILGDPAARGDITKTKFITKFVFPLSI